MPDEITANLGRQHGYTSPTSMKMAASANVPNGAFDANMFRAPEFFVYIHTISDREFVVQQPPLFPSVIFPAKKPGQRSALVLTIPSPMNQIDREGAIGELIVRAHDARLCAASLLNPNNPTLNQDLEVNMQTQGIAYSFGTNLNHQGLFWSLNQNPKEDEIAKAEGRREKYYRGLIEKARTLEISNPKELESLVNQDFHMAAEYFHLETSWHHKYVKFAECPLCGEPIKPGVAAHKNSLGTVCIIDEARAAKMGLTKAALVSTAKSE